MWYPYAHVVHTVELLQYWHPFNVERHNVQVADVR